MSASKDVRRHEAGHAITALALGIGLQEPAITLISDQEACTNVALPTSSSPDEAWCIRRAAVKLAGPIAMIRYRQQEMHWQTLREEGEYASDYGEAERILQKFWLDKVFGAAEHLVGAQMERAACLAIQSVDRNEGAISALAEATKSQDVIGIPKILDAIATQQPIHTPNGME